MEDLDQFEFLSLIAKVTQEISNHTGVNDKTLAEFIVNTHEESSDLENFKAKLEALEAGFSDSFVENLDRIILRMHPHPKKRDTNTGTNGEATENGEAKTKIFTGLAIPDKKVDWEEEYKLNQIALKEMDDTLAKLEGLDHVTTSRKKRRRSRSRSPIEKMKGRIRDEVNDHFAVPHKLDDVPVLYKIYEGRITGIKDFGAFVALDGIRHSERGRADGLVHISAINDNRVNHPSDVVSPNQRVKVKVISIKDGRIGLSMRDVDQYSGKDLTPHLGKDGILEFEKTKLNRKSLDTIDETPASSAQRPNRRTQRMTSPERWEIRQLIASGVLSASQYPELDEEYQAHINGDHDLDADLDVDLEPVEDEPPFLRGQTSSSLQLSPIKVVKAPDGSLARAAAAGGGYARDRRDMRQQQAQQEASEEAAGKDLNSQWHDPIMKSAEKVFAQDLKNAHMSRKAGDMPEWKQATFKSASYGKRTNLSLREQRESLPVFKFRESLLQAVRENQVLIVVGETGSGKTTQLPQYLLEGGIASHSVGRVGCTQPRRVAAQSVAKRVAEEVGCRLGDEVGYAIRFEDVTSAKTVLKYMTDGTLLRECLVDPDMRSYSCIMLDEAHERTTSTDVLFGLLKKTIARRSDLKLIVTSATLDAEKFSAYFGNCPIFSIPGRTYPVEILYTKEPESDYLDAALITVMQIHLTEPPGDILVFLTGQEEIETSAEILYERMKALGSSVPELLILPVYSTLPSEQQSRIFEPAPEGSRKVVLATNIAETSITIDGIYYVVDPGFVKQNSYDSKTGMDQLVVMPISQAQARQRAGRAGRTGPGKCYRLYTENAYRDEMLASPVPEIQRNNLTHTILTLKALGINDLLAFPFMDPPAPQTMIAALTELFYLSALDDEGLLTRLGRKMADFPNDPQLSKALIASVEFGCAEEVVTIVAMLSVNTVFYRPKEKQAQADQKKAKFHQAEGDHLTLLAVYNAWKASNFSNPWCFENFIQARNMRRAQDVRTQLLEILERHKHPIMSAGRNSSVILRALCAGFFRNVARKDPQEGYKTFVEGTPCYIHPSSSLFGKGGIEWVLYHELVLTGREYMRETSNIRPEYLTEAAPNFFKKADTTQLSKRQKAERIEPLYNRFEEKDAWRLSKQKKVHRGGGSTFG